MSNSVVRGKGQITIPADIRRAARLEEGDLVEIEMVQEGILLRPTKLIDATQTWFWSRGWQAGELEAAADREAGRSRVFETADEFLASFDDD